MTDKPSIESLREILRYTEEHTLMATIDLSMMDRAVSELESLRAENEALRAALAAQKMEQADSFCEVCRLVHPYAPPLGFRSCERCGRITTPSSENLRRINALRVENARLGKRVSSLVIAFDNQFGTPCEQVRHQQELEALESQLNAERARADALAARVDDLAMLVRLLVHSIRKHSPDNETARKAMDYLRRHELQGSPLRTTILSPAPDAAKPNNQQEQP